MNKECGVGRMEARLRASLAGLDELNLLRHRQSQMVNEAIVLMDTSRRRRSLDVDLMTQLSRYPEFNSSPDQSYTSTEVDNDPGVESKNYQEAANKVEEWLKSTSSPHLAPLPHNKSSLDTADGWENLDFVHCASKERRSSLQSQRPVIHVDKRRLSVDESQLRHFNFPILPSKLEARNFSKSSFLERMSPSPRLDGRSPVPAAIEEESILESGTDIDKAELTVDISSSDTASKGFIISNSDVVDSQIYYPPSQIDAHRVVPDPERSLPRQTLPRQTITVHNSQGGSSLCGSDLELYNRQSSHGDLVEPTTQSSHGYMAESTETSRNVDMPTVGGETLANLDTRSDTVQNTRSDLVRSVQRRRSFALESTRSQQRRSSVQLGHITPAAPIQEDLPCRTNFTLPYKLSGCRTVFHFPSPLHAVLLHSNTAASTESCDQSGPAALDSETDTLVDGASHVGSDSDVHDQLTEILRRPSVDDKTPPTLIPNKEVGKYCLSREASIRRNKETIDYDKTDHKLIHKLIHTLNPDTEMNETTEVQLNASASPAVRPYSIACGAERTNTDDDVIKCLDRARLSMPKQSAKRFSLRSDTTDSGFTGSSMSLSTNSSSCSNSRRSHPCAWSFSSVESDSAVCDSTAHTGPVHVTGHDTGPSTDRSRALCTERDLSVELKGFAVESRDRSLESRGIAFPSRDSAAIYEENVTDEQSDNEERWRRNIESIPEAGEWVKPEHLTDAELWTRRSGQTDARDNVRMSETGPRRPPRQSGQRFHSRDGPIISVMLTRQVGTGNPNARTGNPNSGDPNSRTGDPNFRTGNPNSGDPNSRSTNFKQTSIREHLHRTGMETMRELGTKPDSDTSDALLGQSRPVDIDNVRHEASLENMNYKTKTRPVAPPRRKLQNQRLRYHENEEENPNLGHINLFDIETDL